MKPTPFLKAGIFAIVIVAGFILSWELYWRSRGFTPSYNDDKILWASKRKLADLPSDRATVFIGPSRIKFDLDIPTWENLTGEKAIQLAIVGTSPRLVLNDLANDEKFKGKLVIDLTEFSIFSRVARREKSSKESLEYYHSETPSQKASAYINYALESSFVFLEPGNLSLGKMLDDMPLNHRKGVFTRPAFPKEFTRTSFDRQTSMTPMFLSNPRLIERQQSNWKKMGASDKTPGLKGDTLTTFFMEIKKSIDKITARGGKVIFIRPPSSGVYLENERVVYPRAEYWDAILAYTGVPGIHYSDYPETANMICPEWSHLAPNDAIIYTKKLVQVLQDEKGWNFKNTIKQ